LVADIRAGNKSGDPTSLAVYNGSLYMTADNGSTGRELYRLGHPTGIQSVSWNGDVQLYPNPATASATLSIRLPASQTLRVLLTDVSGRAAFNSGPRVFDAGRHDVKLP